jgi:hypothetical protein
VRPVILAFILLAPVALHAQDLRVAKTPPGIALDWSGGSGPWDAIAFDLAGVSLQPGAVDLGTVKQVECDSPDATTRGGFEDNTAGGLVGYLVGETDYGTSSDGRPRTVVTGDCGGGGRTELEVCTRWRTDRALQVTDIWSGPTSGCTLGTLDPRAIEDALRVLNVHRWLAGLEPVVEQPSYSAMCQEAALIERGLGTLDHYPDPADPCYTADGDTAAGSSNLAAGASTLAAAVDLYVRDPGISSLGHRRWVLYPDYAEAGFGHVDADPADPYRYYSAQWVFGMQSRPQPEFVAWPSPGPFPIDAPLGTWSFQVDGAGFAGASVSVTRVSDSTAMSVTDHGQLPNGYGWNTLAFDVAGVVAGESYDVTIAGVTGAPQSSYSFVVRFVTCP